MTKWYSYFQKTKNLLLINEACLWIKVSLQMDETALFKQYFRPHSSALFFVLWAHKHDCTMLE